MRLALPVNLHGVQPAFEATALSRFYLRSLDVAAQSVFSARFFNQSTVYARTAGGRAFACGRTVLEVRPIAGTQYPGLDRMGIAIRGVRLKEARRILEQRGIQPRGSKDEVRFRDPDGNELELIV